MMRNLCGLLFSFGLLSASSFTQSPCTVTDHAEYSKKIKEFTTESFFTTELVDHLPLSSCVPPRDAFLHHIIGAPDILDYTKDINAYFRLLASKSSRIKVWSIGMSEEGREMLVAAVSDEGNLAKIERYKEITARLGDPRGLSEAEVQKLIAEGKPMYWADGSIHSPETGAPEMLTELYIPEDLQEFARWAIPPAEQQPRVVLRFAAEKDLLLSGMITGANEIVEKPPVVDVPHGKGHVVLYANNPIWRAETTGSYFLIFNAILNFDHLNAGGVSPTSASSPAARSGKDNDNDSTHQPRMR